MKHFGNSLSYEEIVEDLKQSKMENNKFPIGATWTATDKITGKIGTIWLAEINQHFEVWRWSAVHSDGSGMRFDWCTSYRACKEEIPIHGRFKRVA